MASMCKFEMRANLIWPSGYSEPLTLPGNPGSNLILVTEIEIQFVFRSGRIEEITTDNYSREGTSSLGSSTWRLSP